MTNPMITIAMPVRNCETTISAAVRSILNQTFQDWELLLFDDGSIDGTLGKLNIFKDSRIKILHYDDSKGLPTRLNEAIGMARGDYFARMDGDDVCYPQRLELQLEYMRSHSEVDLVGGGILVFDQDGKVLGKRIPPEYHKAICRTPHAGFPMAHPTYFGRIAWFRRYGYNVAAIRCEDQELLLRAFRTSRYANLPLIVLGYREQLDLIKILKSRWYFAVMVKSEYSRNCQPIIGWRGAFEQVIKATVDILAVVTGLNYFVLRHRNQPVSKEDNYQFLGVWQKVSAAD